MIVRGEAPVRCIACLGSLRSSPRPGFWCRGSHNYQCYFYCCCCFLLLWVPLVASPKKTREQVVYFVRTRKLIAAMSPREDSGGDQLARLVHRGVGSSLRVMVQHARRRVVIGATSYYHGTSHTRFCCCCPACGFGWCVRPSGAPTPFPFPVHNNAWSVIS